MKLTCKMNPAITARSKAARYLDRGSFLSMLTPQQSCGVLKAIKKRRGKAADERFFMGLPEAARIFAIPHELSQQGIHRHGQHGLAHQRAIEKIQEVTKKKAKNVLSLLLGAQTNIAAIQNGKPVEVSDGFSRADGIFSETNCGSVDSALVFQLLADGMRPASIERLLVKESGFKALAGGHYMLEKIFKRKDRKAKFAREIFGYQIMKYIGAYAAVLGGVDLILFIGTNQKATKNFIFGMLPRLRCLGVQRRPFFQWKEISLLTLSRSKTKVYFLDRDRLFLT